MTAKYAAAVFGAPASQLGAAFVYKMSTAKTEPFAGTRFGD